MLLLDDHLPGKLLGNPPLITCSQFEVGLQEAQDAAKVCCRFFFFLCYSVLKGEGLREQAAFTCTIVTTGSYRDGLDIGEGRGRGQYERWVPV